MKKIFLSLLVSALLGLCCVFAGCGAAPDIAEFPVQRTLNPESGLRTFSTEDGLITLKYPHTWYSVSDMQSLARFASPLTDATPDYREYVVIGFELNNSGRTAAQTADAAFGEMKARFPALELTQSTAETVAGRAMEKRVFGGHIKADGTASEGDYFWIQYFFVSGGLSYSITFAGTRQTESAYLPVFEQMLSSMTLDV